MISNHKHFALLVVTVPGNVGDNDTMTDQERRVCYAAQDLMPT
jgi:hypothetical protein